MKNIKIAACLFLFGICPQADAAQTAATVGVHGGIGFLGDGGGAHLDYGLNGSLPFSAFELPFFFEADFSYIDQGTISSSGASTSGSLYLVNGSLNFDTSGLYPNSFLGLALGLGWNHTGSTIGASSSSNTDTDFYLGPRVGVDYSIGGGFTLGGQADWLITPSNAAPNILELLAVLKFWL